MILFVGVLCAVLPGLPREPGVVDPGAGLRALDSTLVLRPGVVRAIVGSSVSIEVDHTGTNVPLSDIVALVPSSWNGAVRNLPVVQPPMRIGALPQNVRYGVLFTTAGEIIPGHPARQPSATADHAAWESSMLGRLEVSLEEIDAIYFSGSGPAESGAEPGDETETATTDVLTLDNGDRVMGFVSGIGASVTIDSASEPLSLDRIAAINLSNPPTDPTMPLIWCKDGSVLGVSAIAKAAGEDFRVARTPTDGAPAVGVNLRPGDLRAVNFVPSRLIPLSQMGPGDWVSHGTRRWSPGPQRSGPGAGLAAAPLRFFGPGTATWPLPVGAGRFAATLELPAECRGWGNPTVTLSVQTAAESVVVWSGALDRASPTANVNVALVVSESPRTLALTIEVGDGVQNEVSLWNALVLKTAEQ